MNSFFNRLEEMEQKAKNIRGYATAQTNLNELKMVQDRKTGEMYNPQERFDQLMNKPEIMAVFKRLAVR